MLVEFAQMHISVLVRRLTVHVIARVTVSKNQTTEKTNKNTSNMANIR